MTEYSRLFRALELEPHHRIPFSVIPRTPLFWRGGALAPLQSEIVGGVKIIIVKTYYFIGLGGVYATFFTLNA